MNHEARHVGKAAGILQNFLVCQFDNLLFFPRAHLSVTESKEMVKYNRPIETRTLPVWVTHCDPERAFTA